MRGSVPWRGHSFTVKVEGNTRVITSDDLPPHPTGRFPISPSDLAYRTDTNPNSIRRQHIRVALPAHPTFAARPHCALGAVGILLTGVPLFNALDAPGRDAAGNSTLVGYTIDGFGTYGPYEHGK
ncbi:MAG: hypothetical protein P8Z80_16985 [Pseudolabrys sp.]